MESYIMKINRARNASLNIIYGLILKLIQILLPFIIKSIMVRTMGFEYLGLSSLFTSILSVLNLTELGVGSALVFSMYKPISEDDRPKICALMNLYKLYYRVIGLVILVLGLLLSPVLPYLVTGELPEDVNLYTLYFLNLASTVLTYWLFSYKNCLLNAHQENNVEYKVTTAVTLFQYAAQIIVLVWVRNYYVYLLVMLACVVIKNCLTALIVDKKYPYYKAYGHINKDEQKMINRRIIDLFTGKIGSVVTNSVDSIVISGFLGLTALSVYSNYYYIFTACVTMVAILFNAVLAGIGNSLLVDSNQKIYDDFKCATLIICWIAGFISCCLMCLFQPFIKWWMGADALLPLSCVVLFAVEFYFYEIVVLCVTYKDAAGIWHEDRFRPLIGAILNLCLNIVLVKKMEVAGIILATIISFAVINLPWLIHNIFSIIFKRSAKEFVFKMFKYTTITVAATLISYTLCHFWKLDGLTGLITDGIICTLIVNGAFFICVCRTLEFNHAKYLILGKLKH